MTTSITIQQLEAVINEHNGANASSDNYALSANVKVLADLYGRMIHMRQSEVTDSELNSAQRALLSHLSTPQNTAAPAVSA